MTRGHRAPAPRAGWRGAADLPLNETGTVPAVSFTARPAFIASTIALSIGLMVVLLSHVLSNPQIDPVMKGLYSALFTGLFYCCLAYQVNRYGAARREAKSAAPPKAQQTTAKKVTILIPSFREERRVLIATVLSAALARHSDRRIVVLIDDQPNDACRPGSLAAIRDVRNWLNGPMTVLRAAAAEWATRSGGDVADEVARLAGHYSYAAQFLDDIVGRLEAEVEAEFAHVDRFLCDMVRDLAFEYRQDGERLLSAPLDAASIADHYRRLATLFCDDIASFERKQFVNLPHAANKAMNLNAYIALLGRRFRIVEGQNGRLLLKAGNDEPADIEVPSADYVLTLDADSVILPDYITDLMARIDGDTSIGVIQTPYRAFPGANTAVERIAGATTDMQYLVHQGSVHFGAGFWVGANALIRVSALEAIATEQEERGHRHKVFVQDRTVIEDTGSTVDLLSAGYRVHNHFRALAYSATPADFGALAVQRQRWSNGGLIILPHLWAQTGWKGLFRNGLRFGLQTHYLLSPVIGNSAVFMLMVLLATDARNLLLMPLAMAPYFLLYGLDLKRNGYRFSEVLSVCALNLMLLPVGFAGVAASIVQMITGRKGVFWRTPKVSGRTRVHPFYLLFPMALIILMASYTVDGVMAGDIIESFFPAANVALLSYGLLRFVGPRAVMSDLMAPVGELPGAALSLIPRPVRVGAATVALGLAGALVPVQLGTATSDPAIPPPTLERVAASPVRKPLPALKQSPLLGVRVTDSGRLVHLANAEVSPPGLPRGPSSRGQPPPVPPATAVAP